LSPPVVVVSRTPPNGSSRGRAALDAALALAAFDQPVALCFLGAGVLQLMPGQDGRTLGRRDLYRQIESLPLFDVETVWAEREALDGFAIAPGSLPGFVTVTARSELRRQLARAAHILTF